MDLKQLEKKFLKLNVDKKVQIFNTYCKIKNHPHQIFPLDEETIELYTIIMTHFASNMGIPK